MFPIKPGTDIKLKIISIIITDSIYITQSHRTLFVLILMKIQKYHKRRVFPSYKNCPTFYPLYSGKDNKMRYIYVGLTLSTECRNVCMDVLTEPENVIKFPPVCFYIHKTQYLKKLIKYFASLFLEGGNNIHIFIYIRMGENVIIHLV